MIFLALALPWPLHQILTHGRVFLQSYVGSHISDRFAGSPDADVFEKVAGLRAGRGPLYYPRVVFYSMFPWSLLLVPALARVLHSCLRRRERPALLLTLWIALFGLVITAAKGKLHWYVIPLLPALSISAAWFCLRAFESKSRVLLRGVAGVAVLLASLFLPAPAYDPYARLSTLWPDSEQNLAALWRLDQYPALSLVPLGVTVGLALVVLARMAFWRGGVPRWDFQRALWIVCLGSFLFSGLYQAVIPLRGVENRHDLARGWDAAREAGIYPAQAVLLGRNIATHGLETMNYFYVSGLSGGLRGEIHPRSKYIGSVLDSTLEWGNTVIVSDGYLRSWFHEYPEMTLLWEGGQVDVHYKR